MAGIITGENASLTLTAGSHTGSNTAYGTSDFSLTIDRDVTEQELIGEAGNNFLYGAISIDGSFTNCKFAASGNAPALYSIIESNACTIDGGTGDFSFTFNSGQITGYDVSFGDASTVTEASIDFTVLNPSDVSYAGGSVTA